MDTTALGENSGASRRRFLQAVGLGGALSALPLVARSAGAQSGSSTSAAATSSTTPATTTTAPPRAPTADDQILLAFAQSVEIAVVTCYASVLSRADELALPADQLSVMQVLRQHHLNYAHSISGLLGRAASGVTNQAVVAQFGDPFTSGTLDEIYVAAAALEDVVAATNTALLGQLQGTNGATLLASILVIEARHATVLGALAGSKDLIPASGVDSTDSALTLDKYPVE